MNLFFCIIFYACFMFIGSLKGRKNFKVGFLLSKNLLGLITGNKQLHNFIFRPHLQHSPQKMKKDFPTSNKLYSMKHFII